MKRMVLIGLWLATASCAVAAAPAPAAGWSRAGWYRLEIFPELKIRSARFSSAKACRKTLPKEQDDVVRCVRLAKAGDEIDRALEFFAAAIEENPRDTSAMNYRGILFAKKGDTQAALDEYARSITTNGDDYWPFLLRGKLLQKLGRREAAAADYREALARHPGDEAVVQMLTESLRELAVP